MQEAVARIRFIALWLLIFNVVSVGLTQTGAAELAGLWGVSRSFGPEIRGELTIRQAGGAWRAQIAGASAPGEIKDGELRFSLPGNRGSFRGRQEGKQIRGFWIQPKGRATEVAWATPVELRPAGAGAWRGTVVPLEEAVTLYLDIRTEADGKLFAVLRNPDGYYRNGRLALVAEGTHLKLQTLQDGRTLLEGDYDAKAGRISLRVPDFDTVFELTRLTRDQAKGYYPSTPPVALYAYRPPVAEKDGWRTSSLAAEGFDETRISALVQKILDTDPRPQTAPLIQGLLIARHGKLVLEEYFYGFDKETRHDIRSGGKTWASVLAGIAIDHGAKFGPETPVYPLFPEYASFANPDPRKSKMTVEHLMTMTSGFACDENDDDAPGNEDKMQSQTAQPDWYKFMLDIPLVAAPGDKAAYCSGAVNLIGGIVRNATNEWLADFFDRNLARPLQFERYNLNLTPTGDAYMGGGTHIRPRDWMKLGQLYLNGGVWNGKRVVSKSWVEVSTVPHPMNAKGGDGYNWHTNQIKAGDRTYRQYEANGNGGQLLMVLPELDLVVVFTAANYMNYGVWRRFRDELLPQYIIEAIGKK
ncbi:MAG TPA: serine hydrolase [Thermoanaerobaculia bacterium]|nr:serine hydrolase [Thermoanaerobaculia bacterium]